MVSRTTREDLKQRIDRLERESAEQQRFQAINRVLFKIANAINTTSNLEQLYASIHKALSPVIDTTNFYIALHDERNDRVTFPYCVDEVDECYPPSLGISKSASLTAEVIRTGQPILANRDEMIRLRARRGHKVPACTLSQVWLGAPLKTRNGIIGVIATQSYSDPAHYDQTDIYVLTAVADQVALAIDRKRAEESLKDSEERYRGLADAAFEAIFISENGTCIDTNKGAADMFGYSQSELIGIKGTDVIAPDSQATVRKNMLSGYEQPYEVIACRKDGTEFHVEIRGRKIEYRGHPARVTVVHDIDARKRAAQEREKLIHELQHALNEIKTLRGILPICASCKKVRDDKGYWNQIEAYIHEHSDAEFSHGICPDCARRLYPELDLTDQD